MIPTDRHSYVECYNKKYFRITLTSAMVSFLDVDRYDDLYMYHDNTYIYLRKKPSDDIIKNELSQYQAKEVSLGVDLGYRVVIPVAISNTFGCLYGGQKLAIKYIENGKVIAFKSFLNHCCICKTTNDLLVYSGVYLCNDCHLKFT